MYVDKTDLIWRLANECTEVYREVFAILKADDQYERFVFITGITKFTQISLFSVLNNLTNISFDAPYAALCGITKDEIRENFMPELEQMGEENDWTTEETIEQLKSYYDGYHFSHKNMVDVFNPFSLINALSDHELKNYWAASGATSLPPKFVDDLDIRLKDFEDCALVSSVIETSDVTGGGPELFLYQSGYLTIKGYMSGTYLLGIPNHEVRQALNEIGGISAAEKQIINNNYLEPFKADKRKVVGLAIELDDLGKGLLDWKVVE